jgi:hypothetical protein
VCGNNSEFHEWLLERLVISVFLEERMPSDGSVEHMEDHSAGSVASGAWHGTKRKRTPLPLSSKKSCVPFSAPGRTALVA